ncbi:MAG: LEPR-XLL domain-containing protein [Pseudomonadota bacterium]
MRRRDSCSDQPDHSAADDAPPLLFEPLEPRVLLSADPAALLPAAGSQNVILEIDAIDNPVNTAEAKPETSQSNAGASQDAAGPPATAASPTDPAQPDNAPYVVSNGNGLPATLPNDIDVTYELQADDRFNVSIASSLPTEFEVSSNGYGEITVEAHLSNGVFAIAFTSPINSLSLNGSSGDDSFVFETPLDALPAFVEIDGGGGRDSVVSSAATDGYLWRVATDGSGDVGDTTGATPFATFNDIEIVQSSGTNDTLLGPADDVEWRITGHDSGTVGGIAFTGFENLQGHENSQDTFIIAAGGSVSGIVHGDNTDVLKIELGSFQRGELKATAADTGYLDLDGNTIEYAGFLSQNVSVATDELTLDLSDFYDSPTDAEFVLEDGVANDGWMTLSSPTGAFSSFTFAVPANKLTINLTDADDTLTIASVDSLFNGGLVINDSHASDDTVNIESDLALAGSDARIESDTITLGAGYTIDTRHMNANKLAIGDSGSITFSGRNILIESGARLLADVAGSSAYRSGDVTISAKDVALRLPILYDKYGKQKNSASVTVESGAEIRGHDVTIRAIAENKSLTDEIPVQVAGYFADLGSLLSQVPGAIVSNFTGMDASVVIREATATVQIDDAVIEADRDVSITSEALASVDVEALSVGRELGLNASGAYAESAATAQTIISGSQIAAGRDALIEATGHSNASALARASINATPETKLLNNNNQPANPNSDSEDAYSLAVAIANAGLTVRAEVDADTVIVADGSINVVADGTTETNPVAHISNYGIANAQTGANDPPGATSVAISKDDATVEAIVDGRLTAKTESSVTVRGGSFDAENTTVVDVITDQIFIENHGYETGDAVTYNTNSDVDGNDPLHQVGGLVNGETYYVIKVDEDHIQLALEPYLDLEPTSISSENQTLTQVAAVYAAFDPVQDDGETLRLPGHGIETGDIIRYTFDGDGSISGLESGQLYIAEKLADDTLKFYLHDPSQDVGSTLAGGQPVALSDNDALGLAVFEVISETGETLHVTASNIGQIDPDSEIVQIKDHGFPADQDTIITYHQLTEQDGGAIGGLEAEERYLVKVIDEDSFQLLKLHNDDVIESRNLANIVDISGADFLGAGHGFTYVVRELTLDARSTDDGGDVNGQANTIEQQDHGLETGDILIYGTDPNATTSDVEMPFWDLLDPLSISFNTIDAQEDSIYLPGHTFAHGDIIRYTFDGPTPIDGLVEDGFYVIVDAGNDRIQLKAYTTQDQISGKSGLDIADDASRDLVDLVANQTHGQARFEQFTDDDNDVFDISQDSVREVVIANIAMAEGNGAPNNEVSIYDHGLVDGQTVKLTYVDPAAGISGLEHELTYTIRVIDEDTIQFLAADSTVVDVAAVAGQTAMTLTSEDPHKRTTISLNAVDETENTINLPGHDLHTGDIVQYQFGGASGEIGGLESGQYYVVERVGDDSIRLKLYTEEDLANGRTGIEVLEDVQRTFVDLTHATGTGTASFSAYGVDGSVSRLGEAQIGAIDVTADAISLEGHGFKDGQTVFTSYAERDQVGGGIDGATSYTVRLIDADTFQLVDPATGEVVDLSSRTGDGAIALSFDIIGPDAVQTLTVQRLNDAEIGGLEHGQAYYVVKIDDHTYRLVEDYAETITTQAIDLTSQGVGGDHQLTSKNRATGIGVHANLESENRLISRPYGEPYHPYDLKNARWAADYGLTILSAFGNTSNLLPTNFIGSPVFGPDALHGQFRVAGGVGINLVDHDVRAVVGEDPNSAPVLQSGRDVEITSNIEQEVSSYVQSYLSKSQDGLSVSLAIAIALYDNNAEAIIGSTASVDAKHDVVLDAEVEYPFLSTPLEYLTSFTDVQERGQNAILPFLDATLGVATKLTNTWARAAAKTKPDTAPDADTVAGSFIITNYDNSAQAIVRGGAKINQDQAYRSHTQSVSVNAETIMKQVEISGDGKITASDLPFVSGLISEFDKTGQGGGPFTGSAYLENIKNKFWGGSIVDIYARGSDAGVGTAITATTIDNTTRAVIEPDARIHVGVDGALVINAEEEILRVVVGQAGAFSKRMGIAGAGVGLDQNSTTHAGLMSDAYGGVIVTGGGDVSITANNDNTQVQVVGSVVLSESTGVGASVVVNDVERDTVAFVGADPADGDKTPTGVARMDIGDLTVAAENSGTYAPFAIAGVVFNDWPAAPAPPAVVPPAAALAPAAGVAAPPGAALAPIPNFDTAAAGAIGINIIKDTTQAYINLNSAQPNHVGHVKVTARNGTDVISLVGGAAINAPFTALNQAYGTSATTMAGTVGYNEIDATTQAYVKGAKLRSDVDENEQTEFLISAERDGGLYAFSVAPSVNTGQQGKAIAGSVAVNRMSDTTEAYVDSADIEIAGDISLLATNSAEIFALTGGLAFSGNVGAAGAFAYNQISNTTRAGIFGTEARTKLVTKDGGLSVQAINDNAIRAIGVSAGVQAGAGSGGGTLAAGTIAINVISTDPDAVSDDTSTPVEAIIRNADVSVAKDITLLASDDSVLQAFAGGLGGGTQSNAYGAALGWNESIVRTYAAIDNSNVTTSDGAVGLYSQSTGGDGSIDGKISSLAIGGALGDGRAIGASASANTIHNRIEAEIIGGSVINADGSVTVRAKDDADINAVTGGAALATGGTGVGAAVGFNTISNTVIARIQGADVTTDNGGDVVVAALENATSRSSAIGLAGADKVAIGGSVAINVINNSVIAAIDMDSDTDRATRVTADGNVHVRAENTSGIITLAGGVGIAANTAVGVAVPQTTVVNRTEAYIDRGAEITAFARGSTMTDVDGNARKGVVVEARSNQNLLTLGVSGAISGDGVTVGIFPSVTVVDDTTRAYIGDGRQTPSERSGSVTSLGDVAVLANSSLNAIGVAGIDVSSVTRTTEAYIGGSTKATPITAHGSVIVDATANDRLVSVSASLSAVAASGPNYKPVAVAPAAGVQVLNLRTEAAIKSKADVSAQGHVVVSAEAGADSDVVAGAVAAAIGSSGTGVGVAASVGTVNKTTEAYIGLNTSVEALGRGAGIAVNTGAFTATDAGSNDGSEAETESFTTADAGFINGASHTIWIDGGHGFKTGDDIVYIVSGAPLAVLDDSAKPGDGLLTGAITFATNSSAQDTLTLADGLSFRDAGFDDGDLIYIGSGPNAGTYEIASIDGATDNVITLTAATSTLSSSTTETVTLQRGTFLTSGARYFAIADPADPSRIQLAASREDAEAGQALTFLDTGAAPETAHTLMPVVHVGVAQVEGVDPGMATAVTKTPEKQLVYGVAVSAVSHDSYSVSGGAAAASNSTSGSVAGGVAVHTIDTRAHIDAGAQINADNDKPGNLASDNQSVTVVAARSYDSIVVGGGLAVSGKTSVSAALSVPVLQGATEAWIDGGSSGYETIVNAKNDVTVLADAESKFVGVAAGVAVAGKVAAAGSASAVVVDTTTRALIAGEVQVKADGNVVVSAEDDTETFAIGGAIGGAIGKGVGIGLGIGVTHIEKSTEALITDGARVNALGLRDIAMPNGSGGSNVLTGDIHSSGAFTTVGGAGSASDHGTAKGVIVDARSSAQLTTYAVSGGLSGVAGIAAGIAVDVVDSDTVAAIGGAGRKVEINQDANLPTNSAGMSDAVSVNVSASNRFVHDVVAGSITGGLAAVGAGITVGVVRNDTLAVIDNADVKATDTVDVNALSHREIDANALAGSVGGATAQGSVLVYTIGGNVSDVYEADNQQYNALTLNPDDDTLDDQDVIDLARDGLMGIIDTLEQDIDTTPAFSFDNTGTAPGIDAGNDSFNLGADHGFAAGHKIYYHAENGDPLTGLESGQAYYVIDHTIDPSLSETEIKLAATAEDAAAGIAIDFTIDPTEVVPGRTEVRLSASPVGYGVAIDTVADALDSAITESVSVPPVSDGTSATIGGDTLMETLHVDIDAHDDMDFAGQAGQANLSGAGFGASVAVINIDADVAAAVLPGATIRGTNPDIGDFHIDATSYRDVDTIAYVGGVGAFIQAAGNGVSIQDSSDVSVLLGDTIDGTSGQATTTIGGFRSVDAMADTATEAKIGAYTGSISGVVGGAFTRAAYEASGTTRASVGDRAIVGSATDSELTVGQISVAANGMVSVAPHGNSSQMVIPLGAGSAAAAVSGFVNIADKTSVETRVAADATVVVDGLAMFAAESISNIETEILSLAFAGAGAVAVAVADVRIAGSTSAKVGVSRNGNSAGGANIQAGRLSVTSKATVGAEVIAAPYGGAIASGNGAEAKVNVDRSSEASIAAGSAIVADNGVAVLSDLDTAATAEVKSVGVGGVVVGAVFAEANVTGTSLAFIGSSEDETTRVTVRDGDLTIQSVGSNLADAYAKAATGGVFASEVNTAKATVTPRNEARLGNVLSDDAGAGALIVDVAGTIEVVANEQSESDAEAIGVDAGGITAGVSVARATVTNGGTTPNILSQIGSHADIIAGDVVVEAKFGDGAAVTFDDVLAKDDIDGTANTLRIENHGLTTGDTVSYDSNGADAIAGLTSGRVYTAIVDDADTFRLGIASDDVFVDADKDQIVFATEHGFVDGDTIYYSHDPAGSAITTQDGGVSAALSDTTQFTVMVIDEFTIKLISPDTADGYEGAATAVDADGTITMRGHEFENGQSVTYTPPADAQKAIGAGDFRIDTKGTDDTSDDALVSDTDADNLYVPDHGYTSGDVVVYTATDQAIYLNDTVGTITGVDANTNSFEVTGHGFVTGDRVRFTGNGPVLAENQDYFVRVVDEHTIELYTTRATALDDTNTAGRVEIGTSAAIGGTLSTQGDRQLVDGQTYIVHVEGDHTIQLLNTEGGQVIALDFSREVDGAHYLTDVTQAPIKGLIAGQTYYVTNVSGDTFQLSTTLDGANVVTGLDAAGLTLVEHQFSARYVDFATGGTGTQAFYLDLQDTDHGDSEVHRILDGNGTALSDANPVAGDGKTGARAVGSSGNLAGVKITEAASKVNVSVLAQLAQDSVVTATNDVAVIANTHLSASALAKTGTGGIGNYGIARSRIDLTANTDDHDDGLDDGINTVAMIGERTVIRAGGDFILLAEISANGSSNARSRGGGGLELFQAYDGLDFIHNTKAVLAQSADIEAGGSAHVQAIFHDSDLRSHAYAYNLSLSGVSESNLPDRDGTFVTSHVVVDVGAEAGLKARFVELAARVNDVEVHSNADATGNGFLVEADATSRAVLKSDAKVLIDTGADIVGLGGVDVIAQHTAIGVFADTLTRVYGIPNIFALIVGNVPRSDAVARIGGHLNNIVEATAGATVTAGAGGASKLDRDATGRPIVVQASADERDGYALRVIAENREDTFAIFDPDAKAKAMIKKENERDQSTRLEAVFWDADIVVGAGVNPTLIIDETGTIVTAQGVTVKDDLGNIYGEGDQFTDDRQIYVDDIAPSGGGKILFDADDGIQNGLYAAWKLDILDEVGTADDIGTFTFSTTMAGVQIENYSIHDLIVRDITTFATADTPVPRVDTRTADIANLTMDFQIGYDAMATDVLIANRMHAQAPGENTLRLDGTILNATGSTRVISERGEILTTYGRDGYSSHRLPGEAFKLRTHLIVTNELELGSTVGSIGSPGGRIAVDLVESDASGDAVASATAAEDIFLDLMGVFRRWDNSADTTIQVDTIDAGRDADILLRSGVAETPNGIVVTGVAVTLNETTNYIQNDLNAVTDPQTGSNVSTFETQFRPDGSPPTVPLTAATGTARTFVETTYNFESLQTTSGQPVAAPGVSAGRNITIVAAEAHVTLPNRHVNIAGFTDLDTGALTVETSGTITLTESDGDMRISRVASTQSDVALTAAAGSIIEVPDTLDPEIANADPAADVIGRSIVLTTHGGGIGAGPDAFLEIDGAATIDGASTHGDTVDATARDGIYLDEVNGDFQVGVVVSQEADVALAADSSIVDVANTADANAVGTNIDLVSRTGSIGSHANSFDINSSALQGVPHQATGRVNAKAEGDIDVTETEGVLNVLVVEAGGEVRLIVPDVTGAAGATSTGEDFRLLGAGANGYALDTVFGEGAREGIGAGHARALGQIVAGSSVTVLVGDDVTTDAGSQVVAGTTITFRGDHNDADAGLGTSMKIQGRFASGVAVGESPKDNPVSFFGNNDDDTFQFVGTTFEGPARAFGSAVDTRPANADVDDGEDVFLVVELASTNRIVGNTIERYALKLDGQGDKDAYYVFTAGSAATERGDYVVNVLDSGAPGDGRNTLDIYGVDGDASQPSDDIFLLRAMQAIDGEPDANTPGAVSLIYGDLAQAQTSTGAPGDRPQETARINYDAGITGQLTVHGRGGNDVFAVDGATVAATLDGGAGDDTFQIGQLYESRRNGNANLAAQDQFETTTVLIDPLTGETAELSGGNSQPLRALGGDGDDTFTVYANQGELELEGETGNDAFVLRAFQLDPATALSTAAEHRYNINGPVAVSGGAGFDKVVVLGTEADDAFAITADRVDGAGISVTLAGGEELREVDGAGGDDDLFVRSTRSETLTRVIGGMGHDTINVASDVTEPIVRSTAMGNSSYGSGPHTLAAIQGALDVIGGEGARHQLVHAITTPQEINGALPSLPAHSDVSERAAIDVLNIFDDLQTADQTGRLTDSSLFGFGMSDGVTFAETAFGVANTVAGGITFRDLSREKSTIEVLNVMLGTGNDHITVAGSIASEAEHGGLTVLHGGGGSDTFIVTGGGGAEAPLVIYGDTSQDGRWYNGRPELVSGDSFGVIGDTEFRFPVANAFTNHGDDVIDASALFANGEMPSVGLTAYGGRGNDTIIGSQAGDHIAGGSGNDTILGEAGTDHIYGDSGFNVDVLSRTLEVVNDKTSPALSSDSLSVGADTINGGAGNDYILSDFGTIARTVPAHEALLTTLPDTVAFIEAVTVSGIDATDLTHNGQADDVVAGGQGDDVILGGYGADWLGGGAGDDVILGDFGNVGLQDGDHRLGHVESSNFGMGASDVIIGGTGRDWILGSGGADEINGDGHDQAFDSDVFDLADPDLDRLLDTDGAGGDDIIFGDHGRIVGADGSANQLTLISTTTEHGDGDNIVGAAGNDIIIAGSGADSVKGGSGDDVILGDFAEMTLTDDFHALQVRTHFDEFGEFDKGLSDYIEGNAGDDLVFGGLGDDVIRGGSGSDRLLGDVGSARFSSDTSHARAVNRLLFISTGEGRIGGNDSIWGDDGCDFVFGAQGNDVVHGGAGDDVVAGDSAETTFVEGAGQSRSSFQSIAPTIGGFDHVFGDAGNDVLVGGANKDILYGNNSEDLLFGDAAAFDIASSAPCSLERAVSNIQVPGPPSGPGSDPSPTGDPTQNTIGSGTGMNSFFGDGITEDDEEKPVALDSVLPDYQRPIIVQAFVYLDPLDGATGNYFDRFSHDAVETLNMDYQELKQFPAFGNGETVWHGVKLGQSDIDLSPEGFAATPRFTLPDEPGDSGHEINPVIAVIQRFDDSKLTHDHGSHDDDSRNGGKYDGDDGETGTAPPYGTIVSALLSSFGLGTRWGRRGARYRFDTETETMRRL